MHSRTSRRTRPPRARASRGAFAPPVRATGTARGPPAPRAPDRRDRRAGRGAARSPASTRAGSRPRRRLGRRGGRARATAATGRTTGAASRCSHGDEPPAGEEGLAAAELRREPLRAEPPLVHLPARAIVEHPLLAGSVLLGRRARRVDDDELGCDTASLREKALAVRSVEVPVEVRREDAIEALIRNR